MKVEPADIPAIGCFYLAFLPLLLVVGLFALLILGAIGRLIGADLLLLLLLAATIVGIGIWHWRKAHPDFLD